MHDGGYLAHFAPFLTILLEDKIHALKTVCLLLGPYRNLTTLTSAELSLHPNVQVFNHGAERVLGNQSIDFIANYSPKRFSDFCEFVLKASEDGQQGSYGGTILKSQAFKKDQLSNLYRARYGENRSKDKIQCLVWKDSQRITHAMRKHGFEFEQVFKQEKQLRFLMPVRNPLDCALSNFRTGHYTIFYTGEKNSKAPGSETLGSKIKTSIPGGEKTLQAFATQFDHVMQVIVSEYAFFLDLQRQFPDRFYCFFQNNFSRQTLQEISDFLQIEMDDRWLSDALLAFDVISKPGYSAELRARTSVFIETNLSGHESFKQNVMALIK